MSLSLLPWSNDCSCHLIWVAACSKLKQESQNSEHLKWQCWKLLCSQNCVRYIKFQQHTSQSWEAFYRGGVIMLKVKYIEFQTKSLQKQATRRWVADGFTMFYLDWLISLQIIWQVYGHLPDKLFLWRLIKLYARPYFLLGKYRLKEKKLSWHWNKVLRD